MKQALPYVIGGVMTVLLNVPLLLNNRVEDIFTQDQLVKSGLVLVGVIVVTRLVIQKFYPDR